MRYLDRSIHYCTKGYPRISLNNKEFSVHVLEWEKNNGKKPQGYDIHHIDRNKKNWNIENLELVTKKDHARIHAGWIRNENKIFIKKPCSECCKILSLKEFHYIKSRDTYNNKCKKCHNKLCKERIDRNKNNLDFVLNIRRIKRESYRRLNNVDDNDFREYNIKKQL